MVEVRTDADVVGTDAIGDVVDVIDVVLQRRLGRQGPVGGEERVASLRRQIVRQLGESPESLRDVSVSLNKVADSMRILGLA